MGRAGFLWYACSDYPSRNSPQPRRHWSVPATAERQLTPVTSRLTSRETLAAARFFISQLAADISAKNPESSAFVDTIVVNEWAKSPAASQLV